MNEIKILSASEYGENFIPKEYIPEGKDEYHIRNKQLGQPENMWRNLKSDEIETFVKNGNTCENWDYIFVTDTFDAHLIKNNIFSGVVRIGKLEKLILDHHNLQIPTGITNSFIISCDIGENCSIHNVNYLAHFILGKNIILFNINEMHTTNHAKFGNGIIKDGEDEDVRIWIELMNEMGGRSILPFDGIIPADAYIWLKYRQHNTLIKRLKEITEKKFDSSRGYYGTVDDFSVIKNTRIIKDVKIGSCCYIKGANKLKNLTINSSEQEPTQIGEGVELVNGIIDYGCRIFYGCKAVRFIMGRNTNLKYGARLIHSYLGDNSTVSCCEILHNLIFPAHEQHHNNSFLIATMVKGQSNLAAGSSVGSNHNSRANDGEIEAGRGFWPGLCATVKHSCRFASFILLAKGNYPAEMNIPLPFSLLSNDWANDRLLILPAFWWLYNMYALARNSWKFQKRDKRKIKKQNIEFDSLAPDTIEEIFAGLMLLEKLTAKAYLHKKGDNPEIRTDSELIELGKRLLNDNKEKTAGLEVLGENMEKSKRKVIILKTRTAYHAYRQMIQYYSMKNILDYIRQNNNISLKAITSELSCERDFKWINLGGQIAKEKDINKLLNDISERKLNSWNDIHKEYDKLWESYKKDKLNHAFASLCDILNTKNITQDAWETQLDEFIKTQEYVSDQVYLSRKKDFDNPFRQATFDNQDEMKAVIHTPEENSFVKQVKEDTIELKKLVSEIRKRI